MLKKLQVHRFANNLFLTKLILVHGATIVDKSRSHITAEDRVDIVF